MDISFRHNFGFSAPRLWRRFLGLSFNELSILQRFYSHVLKAIL